MSAVALGSKRIKGSSLSETGRDLKLCSLRNSLGIKVSVSRHPQQNKQQAKHQYLETNTGNILRERAMPKAKWEETKGKIQEKLESVTKH